MILVLLGTFHKEFARPLHLIEKLCVEGLINEEVVVQCGYTRFESKYMRVIPFISPLEMDDYYRDARIVITHAGTGSILKGVKMGKKMIAVARYNKYNEHVDDHQLEILSEFEKMGYLLAWRESQDLRDLLVQIQNFSPAPYKSGKDKVVGYLIDYIESL